MSNMQSHSQPFMDISAAEKELERSIRNEDLLRLMRLQKTLVYFNTSIRGNALYPQCQ